MSTQYYRFVFSMPMDILHYMRRGSYRRRDNRSFGTNIAFKARVNWFVNIGHTATVFNVFGGKNKEGIQNSYCNRRP
ncbi:hypothetical protein TRIP_C20050 [Candidatus Zixiibacteriota bacterium]|nr:hypothetical protein TRIP_C20050 [candidate division Zixibacteria bacterium]